MIKVAPEGFPFISVSFALTIICYLFWPAGVFLPILLAAFMVYFFRDPERSVPSGENIFVAPADGKIILIRNVFEEKYLNKEVTEISIFMSPLNVHVNRVPCDGKIRTVRHNKGSFLAAYKDEASVRNENIEMTLETAYGDILLRQVAGFVARRAVCRKEEGDVLKRGERYGIIKFSSRVDVYLPKDVSVNVKLGDMVKAGETVIAAITHSVSA